VISWRSPGDLRKHANHFLGVNRPAIHGLRLTGAPESEEQDQKEQGIYQNCQETQPSPEVRGSNHFLPSGV
jgi:hypothetical protein